MVDFFIVAFFQNTAFLDGNRRIFLDEEIVDPEAGNGPSDAEDNDSTDPEDMVPEGSNSNVDADTDQSGDQDTGSGTSKPGTSGSEAGTSGGSHGSGSNHDTVTGSGAF